MIKTNMACIVCGFIIFPQSGRRIFSITNIISEWGLLFSNVVYSPTCIYLEEQLFKISNDQEVNWLQLFQLHVHDIIKFIITCK